MTEIDACYVARLEADNLRLRRLLEQREGPRELRHRLRDTLALLRVIIRKTAETPRDLSSYVAHLQDRLDALARAQAAADVTGVMQLHDLLSDELLRYTAREGHQAHLSGPQVLLLPRPAQVLSLAIHELAVNALEHGALRSEKGRIHIDWTIKNQAQNAILLLTWKERGPPLPSGERPRGFGFKALPREVGGEPHLAFEQDGLRFTLRLPLTDQIGSATL
ncbi:HWE histidine kinase domain-containing protein [Brevundimonas nasdae]|uniref:histidine kinase n=1 Tax=Brevundimonas nasdae TaxID=172043 RepID=A0ABX8THG6_9CAUL|nr:HWE histidine kinase domain-containing protein [Brevundimonas nasdae]QYC10676.1 hypothetical protein KWG56_01250 [Brevundimonas nasdae]QYC13463.1 hypothetical protein KWG63_14805 [Brevundimonas nasdae]